MSETSIMRINSRYPVIGLLKFLTVFPCYTFLKNGFCRQRRFDGRIFKNVIPCREIGVFQQRVRGDGQTDETETDYRRNRQVRPVKLNTISITRGRQ